MSYFDSENEYDPWAPAYSFSGQPAAPQPSFAATQSDLPAPQPAFAPQPGDPLQGFPTQQPAFQFDPQTAPLQAGLQIRNANSHDCEKLNKMNWTSLRFRFAIF